jgi:hypothetical protein
MNSYLSRKSAWTLRLLCSVALAISGYLTWVALNAAQETGMLRANISLAKDFEPVLHWWFFTITREQGGSKWLRQKVANGLGNSSPG